MIEPAPFATPPARGWRRRGRLLAAALRPPARPLAAELMAPRGGVASRSSRLVPEPVFVLSPIRAGSTLLRVLLNSHSQIRAPHEMHLRTLHVTPAREFSADVMADLGLDKDELEHLLWDRILHLELQRSGKSVIVDKTPANVLIWKRLRRAWPQAKYLVLLRDPAAIVESVVARRADGDRDEAVAEVAGYARRLDAARRALPCLTIRYEDLTSDPAAVTQLVCAHLGVGWDNARLRRVRPRHIPAVRGRLERGDPLRQHPAGTPAVGVRARRRADRSDRGSLGLRPRVRPDPVTCRIREDPAPSRCCQRCNYA